MTFYLFQQLFCFYSFFVVEINKCKKCFMIYILQIESFKISTCKILKIHKSKTVVKICENDFSSTILDSRTKVKLKILHNI